MAGPMLGEKYPQSGGEHLPSSGGEYFRSGGGDRFPSGGGGHFPSGGGGHFPSGGGGHFPSGGGGHFPSGGNTNNWASKLCANSSLAQAFLSNSQAVITQLNSNGSFAQFLQQKAQEVAYIENSANVALLSSNCTQYFNGLATAQNADMQTQR
ncbi:unnamed protein product [Rotaria magnacalcarata]|uniref:Uncharacterized protein n=1 Tax=Rotaria magnacalcarata TaxID=392030 RepID=A0A816XU27_9BILA|nr:unnamed protein product [Rotaria magnacalcarata]CAF4313608.1 unnamed protein product [Rotaria magnacalcarata]